MDIKLGRYTFSKTASDSKIERKKLIDDNTLSKSYYFRRVSYKIFDPVTDEIALQGSKEYKTKSGYDFDGDGWYLIVLILNK